MSENDNPPESNEVFVNTVHEPSPETSFPEFDEVFNSCTNCPAQPTSAQVGLKGLADDDQNKCESLRKRRSNPNSNEMKKNRCS